MTRTRKLWLGSAAALALLAGTATMLPPLLRGDGRDDSHVVSIKTAPTYQSAALLARAWELPVARRYKDGLDFQGNGSFCGPTSIVNVLRSLGMSATQDDVLAGTSISTVFGFLPGGVTLDELAELARARLGKEVAVRRDLDLSAFRALIARANDEATRLIVNFHRGPLFGQGGGHHSPIAGYLADDDLVFVLDVNRKYQPWLVETARLFEAIDTVDATNGKKRGVLVIGEAEL